MFKQVKMTNNGQVVYPQTVTDAVADNKRNKTLTAVLDELNEAVFPLVISKFNVTPTLSEYTGSATNVTLEWTCSCKGEVVTPSALTITKTEDGVTTNVAISTIKGNDSVTTSINSNSTVTFTIKATYNGMTKSATATSRQVLPTYIGFSANTQGSQFTTDHPASGLGNKKIVSSATCSATGIKNPTAGNYLWVVTPHTVGAVSTDPKQAYSVEMTLNTTDQTTGLKYYRSNEQMAKLDSVDIYVWA